MADRISVRRDGLRIYDIVLEHSFRGLKAELKKLAIEDRKICIVTDSNVAGLYLE